MLTNSVYGLVSDSVMVVVIGHEEVSAMTEATRPARVIADFIIFETIVMLRSVDGLWVQRGDSM